MISGRTRKKNSQAKNGLPVGRIGKRGEMKRARRLRENRKHQSRRGRNSRTGILPVKMLVFSQMGTIAVQKLSPNRFSKSSISFSAADLLFEMANVVEP